MATNTKDALPLAIKDLAETVPSLRRLLADRPTVTRLRDVSLHRTNAGSGAVYAAEFILSLWDLSALDIGRAWGVWDSEHRAAWKAWAANPWWP